jgi:hypothetical protein
MDAVWLRWYAVHPLGQTAGLNWKRLLSPASHPEGWQSANRESVGPEARTVTVLEPDSKLVVMNRFAQLCGATNGVVSAWGAAVVVVEDIAVGS